MKGIPMNSETTAAVAPVGATAPAATKRPMREDDLLELVWIADPQISPDGTFVAFTRVEVDRKEDSYRTSLWLVPTAGGEARALTSGPRDSQPRWSPDGRRLAFTRKPDAEKPPQIHVLPMDGGEAAAITSLDKGASSAAWSPNGQRIAFSSEANPLIDDPKPEKPKHEPARVVTRPVFRENDVGFYDLDHLQHVWVVDASGGTPRQLTAGKFAEGAPRWSRDGEWILFVSDRRDEPWFGIDESHLYAVSPDLESPTAGAGLQLVVDYRGPVMGFAEADNGRFATIGAVLPDTPHSYDQMSLLLHSGAWPMQMPAVVHATRKYAWGEGINSDQHPPRGGGAVPFAFSAGGDALLAQATREGSAMLVRVDVTRGEEMELTPRGRDLIAGTASADGRMWALTLGSVERPADLYALDTQTGELTRLVAPNEKLFAEVELGSVEEFSYPSFDGERIQGWIVKPPHFDPAKKYPLVMEIHGGPHTAYGHGFFHEFHVLAGAGNVVFYPNPRGSTGYGWEFANVIQFRFPGDDAKDLLAGVDAILALGYVDPKRMGVTGGSGGGLLTNWLITQTDRFAAACTQRCVSEWASMMYSADFAMYVPIWFRKQPFQDPAEYAALSPITHVERITTPLMIIHSEEDWRTPIGQGEVMFRALKFLRRPVVMVRFPGENHELSRSGTPSRRVQNQQHIRKWFDHWLAGKKTEEYGV
jgi:dipeptidyl aminopeptidase/acylaminoacyl peptidase